MEILPKPRLLNNRWEIVSLSDKERAVEFAVHHFIESANDAIQHRGQFAVALSGGSTPAAIFKALATPDNREKVDWSKVFLFWSDERSVPPDHTDSNYKMAMDSGLAALPLNPDQIFRMQAESDIEVHAAAYERLIKEKTDGRFDLTMLGMGDDGHTASLFPGSEALNEEKKLVTANYVAKFDTQRMTCTYPCINASRRIAIYVMGARKEHVLREVLLGDENPDLYPVQKIGTAETPALWITDIKII